MLICADCAKVRNDVENALRLHSLVSIFGRWHAVLGARRRGSALLLQPYDRSVRQRTGIRLCDWRGGSCRWLVNLFISLFARNSRRTKDNTHKQS